MVEELLKAIPVFLLSMLKFILGPISGFGAKLHFVTTLIVTVGGMMTSVFGFTYFGDWIREHILNWIKKVLHNFRMWLRTKVFKSKKKPTKKRSAFWSKYGLAGVACFTPIILTPIGGTLLALSMGHDRRKIIIYMLISAVAWGLIFCSLIYFVGEKVLPDFVK